MEKCCSVFEGTFNVSLPFKKTCLAINGGKISDLLFFSFFYSSLHSLSGRLTTYTLARRGSGGLQLALLKVHLGCLLLAPLFWICTSTPSFASNVRCRQVDFPLVSTHLD